jgi:hypothetical protein
MKRTLMAVAGVVALGFVAANLNISQPQAITDGVLMELKLEQQPNTTGLIGGPTKFKITKATLDHLTKLHHDGKVIVATSNGSIHVE